MSKVLIIDDDPLYAQMVLRKLTVLGHEGATADCATEGLRVARRFEPDVVFLDVNLPDGSGLEVMSRIKELTSRPEVVIVTGCAEADGAELAIRSGAWDYIRKGGPETDLTLTLAHVLDYRGHRIGAKARALDTGPIVGQSPALRACLDQLAEASGTDASVLISGETGTGKEVFARVLHNNSRRRKQSFVVVDCAALPESLVESVLFGHTRGAFTGAVEDRMGLVELADGGTLFLDEVGELPLTLQKTFLRVLQERKFRPVGSGREVPSDFRLIAATNKDLEHLVSGGTFRQDLLFRLRGIAIELPPLRGRGEDLREIVRDVVAQICEREGLGTKSVSPEFYATLSLHPWPGNVRELVQALEHAVAAASQHNTLYPMHLPTAIRVRAARTALGPVPPAPELSSPGNPPLLPFQDYRHETTKRYLTSLMTATQGDVEEACRRSGISRAHLYTLLKEYNIHKAP